MTPALREIIRLWLRQKRHDFHWQQVFMTVYFGGLYLAVLFGIYFGFREELKGHPIPPVVFVFLPAVAVSMQFGDLLMKLFWRRSPVEMDDYLRTRPVSPRDWSRFVLLETSQSFLQWMLALLAGVAAMLFLPFWSALLAMLLIFSVSLVNALFQNCWRRAPGNAQTLPLVFGYIVWTGISWAIAIAAAFWGLMLVEQSEEAAAPAMTYHSASNSGDYLLVALLSSVLFLAVNALVVFILHRYFTKMKNHNEELHAAVSTRARALGEVSLWSIEWVQLLRSKRLRTSFLIIAVVFLLNTYMQQQPTIQSDFHGVNIMLLFGMGFPSLILAQWVLGIEANFFAGIWTKPWSLEGILRRKYLFFCGLCGIMALLILPCVFFMGMSPWSWLSALLFSCGFFILPFMATCLFSSRMDLFSSAFFNYQGGNKQLNVFSFIMFVPIAIYYAAYFLLPSLWAHLLVSTLGALGILLHRPYIHWISTIWHRRRYEIMERWQAE